MQKPEGYDETRAFTGDFEILPLGGHICFVKQAKLDKTKMGKDVLILLFDIFEGEHKDFYKRDFERRKENNAEAKWPAVYRQLTEGKSLSFFKGMITAIENSNGSYKWNWDESTLKGKLFGGVFGQEEYEANDGNVKLSTKCRWIRSVEQIRKGVEVPEIKRLAGKNDTSTRGQQDNGTLPDGNFYSMTDDDDLPF
jgi:hypothetical protein